MLVKTYGSAVFGIDATTITVEVNLGIGMNMLFPETVKIVIEDDTDDETTKKPSKVKPEIEIEKE